MRIGFGGRGLAAVALACHLLTTFGFPVPTPPQQKGGGTPYPCQTRPCGCLTSDECWKGDCCCFTIEEKLRWAEENGVEPPAHVRPLVEPRKSQPAPPKKKKSCCSEPKPAPSCCANVGVASACCAEEPACCREEASCGADAASGCAACASESAAPCCQQKPLPDGPAPDRSGVRWVIGVHAQKCRGQGPAGLFLHDPSFVPDPAPVFADRSERDRHPAPRSDRAVAVPHVPPTPPPRAS